MTPDQFITKWDANTRNEQAASKEHFLDLCALLDVPVGAPLLVIAAVPEGVAVPVDERVPEPDTLPEAVGAAVWDAADV